MNQGLNTYQPDAAGQSVAVQRNRVLRNTYWLLALSMVPTVLGAWVGVSTGLFRVMSPGVGLVVFLVGALGINASAEFQQSLGDHVRVGLGP